MRKRLIAPIPPIVPPPDEGWLDLDRVASVEVTSEEKDYGSSACALAAELELRMRQPTCATKSRSCSIGTPIPPRHRRNLKAEWFSSNHNDGEKWHDDRRKSQKHNSDQAPSRFASFPLAFVPHPVLFALTHFSR
jgi:hypothetical protein